jgi:hypothetical protein
LQCSSLFWVSCFGDSIAQSADYQSWLFRTRFESPNIAFDYCLHDWTAIKTYKAVSVKAFEAGQCIAALADAGKSDWLLAGTG